MINSFFEKYFKNSMMGPIVLITVFMFIGLLYLIPYLTKEQLKKDAYEQSERLTTYIRMFRSYYNDDILLKIKEHSNLKVNFDHKLDNQTVPLPATVVHDLGNIFTEGSEIQVQMYSNFPFPNREDRVLDKFQQESLEYILKNPEKTYSREGIKDGELFYRTSFPDYLSADGCVNCHNTRADTPKNDWKLGEVRGVIEIDVPIDTFGILENKSSMNILLFIMFNFSLVAIYYFIFISRRNRELEEKSILDVQLLSEYKKAVDMGAIVSKADLNGEITYINDSFAKISGYTKEELIGKAHSIVRHPDSDKAIFKDLWETILAKKVWQGDLKNRAKDGSPYYVFATIVPILGTEGEILEFLAIRYDTTNLHEAIQKAYEAEKAKGRFLANMSHELRTPLNAIIGFSQILQRKNSLDEKDKKYADKINLSGKNLLTLVNSILDFSKMDENKMEFHPVKIDIKDIFQEVLIIVETGANEKNIKLNMFKTEGFTEILADPQLLKQAFINVLSNAIKFSDNNSEIDIGYKYRNKQHIFSVCDKGHGMSEIELKEIFTPFKQGESATKSSINGTGLGMAITYKIIKDIHGGDIRAESELGEGSCFYISLNE